MLSFRKKILLSDILLFLIFIALLFPFVEKTVSNIMRKSLEDQATHLIIQLMKEKDVPGMIGILEEERNTFFHQVTLIDPEEKKYYNTHGAQIAEMPLTDEYEGHHPEIHEALQYGRGYSEGYSDYFKETFTYVAIRFTVEGNPYILRIGFPYHEIRSLTTDFEIGFILLGSFILLLYSLMTWAIIHRLSRPIQQIIDAILPYQEGREEFLRKIVLHQTIPSDEFSKLAYTLNSLSEKIQRQIENLTRQRKETEDILESLSEGVVAFDTSAKVTFANQVSCRMLGVHHDVMMGRMLNEIKSRAPFLESLAKKCHENVLQALQTSETTVQTWTQGEGSRVYLDLISAPLAHQSGAILVLQDKTSDYKIVEMGKDFIANASHELRTPITIIRGFAETLQDIPDISQQMMHEITEKIVRTCGRLDKLVKSLLTLADIENLSEERFRTCDLSVIVENCKHILLAAHPEVRMDIEKKTQKPYVIADGDLLDLAIMNLLENAVKYSPAPAYVAVTIEKMDEKTVRLSIQDKGIGIPEKDLPHIFDRFYTVDKARSRKSGGAGLGLSIVKTIIDKHKGTIRVISQPGEGSCFMISLPSKNL
ncbi:MAG: PAS domain-containing protein [Verrucomicrobia bacterium]|nr:PAS domain-containing protein [Verrucomicrobiota bacterium]